MIRATPADRAEIEATLAPHAPLAMFPLNNLARFGMAGGHPYAVTMWFGRKGGAIADVLTQTESGMVFPFLPSGDYAAAADALRGRGVAGIAGVRDWARGLERAVGLTGADRSMDQDEPHFALDLRQMTLPAGPGRIVPLADAPMATIKEWMLDYQLATLHTPADQATKRVEDGYDHYITSRSHICLMDGDTPFAMTGFNAQLPDIVQVGGVYTPPPLRGQGYVRRALALHLAEVQGRGVRRAALFSGSEMAARAYRAIGFRPIGEWTLLILGNKEAAK